MKIGFYRFDTYLSQYQNDYDLLKKPSIFFRKKETFTKERKRKRRTRERKKNQRTREEKTLRETIRFI